RTSLCHIPKWPVPSKTFTANLAFVKTGLAQFKDVGSTNVDVKDQIKLQPQSILRITSALDTTCCGINAIIFHRLVPFTSTLVDPTSLNWARPVLTNARLAVKVFDGTGHFGEYELLETTLLNRMDDVSLSEVYAGNDDGTIVTLKGVHYSPKLKKNLISVGTLESKGIEVRAKDGVMKIISGVLVVMKGIHKINNTYHYKGRTVVGTVAAVTDDDRNSKAVKLWHMRLGHAGEKSINLLIKQGLLKGLSSCKLDLCEHCINGKTTMVKFRTVIHKTQGILDYVHSDMWDPLKTR
nr:Gag_pre-integrs domain-containing protein [Tanacetum cinerariifolium]